MGKGKITLQTKYNSFHTISNVFFVPDLKTNLLSIGQEKGHEISIKNGLCQIEDSKLGLIAQVNMNANRMFPLHLQNSSPSCFSASMNDTVWLWHFCYRHLNFGGLKTLQQKKMVDRLPYFSAPAQVCEECAIGKEHRDPFPKGKTQRERQLLEIVLSDLCGPVNPTSNGDRGGEYISNEFADFCESHGIRRQLTATYTPQQNGVCERKNRTILNIVRSLLMRRSVPKTFWPEAVNWSIHILNRSPTLAVQNMTPQEAWSGRKPSVDHFKVFGCVAYAHIPNQKRTKLDDKGEKCIFLGVSDCSKAYKLYNPVTKKIVIRRDIIFDEEAFWKWNGAGSQQQIPTNFDGQDEAEKQQSSEMLHQPVTAQDHEVVVEDSLAAAREPRSRKRLTWMSNYKVTGIDQSEDPLAHFALFCRL